MARVFIGVDPHKLSATIEVVDDKETVLATGRFATDKAGYTAMRKHVAAFPGRTWAVAEHPLSYLITWMAWMRTSGLLSRDLERR